jgi:hypothetical protein
VRSHEVSRFPDNFLRVADDCIVVRVLLSQLIKHRGCDLLFVRERRLIRIWKIFFVERDSGFIDGCLRLLQVGLRTLHNFFHRQIGGEREAQLLSELLCPEAEIAVRARQQIVLEPFFVILERHRDLFLQGCKFLL